MRKTLLLLTVCLVATCLRAQTAASQSHVVQSGETLYSIARRYNVPVATLLSLNPTVDADHIYAGQTLTISNATPQGKQAQPPTGRPKYKTMHEVMKKETIYSVARRYNVTEQQLMEANPSLKKGKLKKGEVLNIPYTLDEQTAYAEQLRQQEAKRQEEERRFSIRRKGSVNVAVILPFSAGSEVMTADAQKMANLYQGFLLAVDSLKRRGLSVNIHAFDEGFDAARLLHGTTMREMDLIVGPGRQHNVATVARFASDNSIVHVVPMSNEAGVVDLHPTTFQVNVPLSLMYTQVYNRFVVMHRSDNIIFVDLGDTHSNCGPYVRGFKQALDAMGVSYRSVSLERLDDVAAVFSRNGRNVLIPSSSSSAAFEALCRTLRDVSGLDAYKVQLFGYPEWQTFPSKYEAYLTKYNSQFFTAFYSNTTSPRTARFNTHFQQSFHQSQYNSYPRYGEMGYDIGRYFLQGLWDYGSTFAEHLHGIATTSLEFPFTFERTEAGSGWQNRTVLIVTYQSDGTKTVR